MMEQLPPLKKKHPSRKGRSLLEEIGKNWHELDENGKKPYQDKHIKDKERYRKELQDYLNKKALKEKN